MVDRLPSFNFGFEGMNKIFLGKAFIFAQIYFLYQVLFWNHFAGDYVPCLGVNTDVCWCETSRAQKFILDLISTVDNFQSGKFLHMSPLLFGVFTLHFKKVNINKVNVMVLKYLKNHHKVPSSKSFIFGNFSFGPDSFFLSLISSCYHMSGKRLIASKGMKS